MRELLTSTEEIPLTLEQLTIRVKAIEKVILELLRVLADEDGGDK